MRRTHPRARVDSCGSAFTSAAESPRILATVASGAELDVLSALAETPLPTHYPSRRCMTRTILSVTRTPWLAPPGSGVRADHVS